MIKQKHTVNTFFIMKLLIYVILKCYEHKNTTNVTVSNVLRTKFGIFQDH